MAPPCRVALVDVPDLGLNEFSKRVLSRAEGKPDKRLWAFGLAQSQSGVCLLPAFRSHEQSVDV